MFSEFASEQWTNQPQHTLFLRPQPHYLLEALMDIVRYSDWPYVVIFYDDSIGKKLLMQFNTYLWLQIIIIIVTWIVSLTSYH